MRPAILIPAFNAADTVEHVVRGLRAEVGEEVPIWVVDDGSTDATSAVAEKAGARVLRHAINRGKGAAIRTGFAAALEHGCDVAVTVDADGQHPPEHAARLLDPSYEPTRWFWAPGISRAPARRAATSSAIARRTFSSRFARGADSTTRSAACGATPSKERWRCAPMDQRFGFEAEIIFALLRAGIPVVEAPVVVLYPRKSKHSTHYRAFKDTVHIVLRIIGHGVLPGSLARGCCARCCSRSPACTRASFTRPA